VVFQVFGVIVDVFGWVGEVRRGLTVTKKTRKMGFKSPLNVNISPNLKY